MARSSYATQLEGVEAAIKKIQDGAQSYKIGDREFNFADLDALTRERDKLLPLATREASPAGGIRFRKASPR